MTKAIALSRATYSAARDSQAAVAQGIVVLACAAALILAGQPLPL